MTSEEASIIKGMLKRGDKQQWIVAWFGGELNPGRIAEVKAGERFPEARVADDSDLPPVGPYVSGRAAHHALLALQPVRDAVDRAMAALSKMDDE